MKPPILPQDEHRLVLQVIQPGLLGLMDGAVSTLAPLFAAAGLTGEPHKAFLVGMAAALGAALSMGLAEALSDDGKLSGRGHPFLRGTVTGVGTFLGGTFHTLPFLIPHLGLALVLASAVVLLELFAIAWIRYRYMRSPLGSTVVQVLVGGGLVFLVGLTLGRVGGG
ncbi:VIT family protein [Thermus tengchongensis]|uniref:VIT family protein n=1 Tax=Thermus tengchongensis TaxID=1214928 RepID=A0ABY2KD86_9DEIN|nr:VIT family protein [Thermus tengchongensis]TFU17758.1 VIT family protein [Thermus tengchongensis]